MSKILHAHEVRQLRKYFQWVIGGLSITPEEAKEGLRLLGTPEKSEKVKTHRRAARAEKQADATVYRQSTKEIRAVCMERADGRCEACGYGLQQNGGGQLDHWESGSGRRREKQTTWNCWILCARCHYRRTHNQPDAIHWNIAFGKHCGFYGYTFNPHVEKAALPRRTA